MSSARDYPITTPFGWVPGYPLNINSDGKHPGQGFHKGVDYGCPDGTPIVVNGVKIGLSGHTGEVTGPHCHVGKWVDGITTDPSSEGWQLKNPRVTDIGYDSTNGYYVGLLDENGTRWVYLHMMIKSTFVKVGDYLNNLSKQEDDDMGMYVTDPLYRRIWSLLGLDVGPEGRQPTVEEMNGGIGDGKRDVYEWLDEFMQETPIARQREKAALFDSVVAEIQKGDAADSTKKLAQIKQIVNS